MNAPVNFGQGRRSDRPLGHRWTILSQRLYDGYAESQISVASETSPVRFGWIVQREACSLLPETAAGRIDRSQFQLIVGRRKVRRASADPAPSSHVQETRARRAWGPNSRTSPGSRARMEDLRQSLFGVLHHDYSSWRPSNLAITQSSSRTRCDARRSRGLPVPQLYLGERGRPNELDRRVEKALGRGLRENTELCRKHSESAQRIDSVDHWLPLGHTFSHRRSLDRYRHRRNAPPENAKISSRSQPWLIGL